MWRSGGNSSNHAVGRVNILGGKQTVKTSDEILTGNGHESKKHLRKLEDARQVDIKKERRPQRFPFGSHA